MALDDSRVLTRAKLKESYVEVERQKAVMFATLNRVRQSLQDQGAQPQLHQGSDGPASRMIPDVPFLWMPQGPACTTQQGLNGVKGVRTGSGSVGLRSVNKVHGLASPEHEHILDPTVTHARTSICTQNSNGHAINAKVPLRHPDSTHQGFEGAARSCTQGYQPGHPGHNSSLITHPTVPSVQSEAMGQQQAETGQQQLRPASQQPHTHQHQAAPQHSQQPAAAVHMQNSPEVMPQPMKFDQIHQSGRTLWGVRHVAGGWEARLGRHGHTRAKESLGVHATAFAAARVYDRAMLATRQPSELHKNLNFPVQDYTAADSPDISRAATAAMTHMHRVQPKLCGKRPRPPPAPATHPSPSCRHRPSDQSHAQLRHAAGPPVGRRNTLHSSPVKQWQSWETATDQNMRHRPMAAAGNADRHQAHPCHGNRQLHAQAQAATDSGQPACKPPAGAADMPQDSRFESGQHAQVPDDEPSTSGNHCSQSGALSGRSLATKTRHADHVQPPSHVPAADLDVSKASSLQPDRVPAEAAARAGQADHDAGRHRNIPATAGQQGDSNPHVHPAVCHAHKQDPASPPHEATAGPHSPDALTPPTKPQADGPAVKQHANATEPHKAAEAGPHVNPQSEAHRPTSEYNTGDPPAAREGPMPSAKPETVRAADCDDDVEIMDLPLSQQSLPPQDTVPDTQDCTGQQAEQRSGPYVPTWEAAEEGLAPCNQEQQLPEHLPDQLPARQHSTAQDEQDAFAWEYQQHQQQQPQQQHQHKHQQQQQQPAGERPQVLQPQQEQQHSSWQQNVREQPHQQHEQPGSSPVGMSSVHADMSGLSHLAHQILTAAGRHCLPLPNDAAVKQEPPPSQPRATPPLPCRRVGQTPQETLAGSSSTHPLELSESDADSSASSSVDPSQRVPAPWLHADTAASKRQEAAVGDGAVAAAHALLRQALQGSTLTSGHLRTKRGPTDKAEGPRSKLARVTPTPPSMPPEGASHGSRRGATAAEAVDLSDDDDDVVIIEENMQPQGHKPSAPAPVKQPGAPPATRPSLHFKPRVPAAAAAARTALFGPPSGVKPPKTSSLQAPASAMLATTHPQATQAGEGGQLQASSVLSATLAALRQASLGHAQAEQPMGSADDEEPATSTAAASAAAVSVVELRRTEQQSTPEFRAAQEAEWQQRQAEIGKQAEHAQRLKRQRRAEKEKKARQEAEVARRLAEHRADEGRKEAAEQEKDQLRVRMRRQLAVKLGDAKSLRQVLMAFRIPIDGGLAATPAQLDKAYKKAMILFHPDKHVNKGLEKQLEAEEAFKIVSHARNRKSTK